MDTVRILGLQPEHVAELWPALKPSFDSFEARSATKAHEFLADILEKRRQCWIAWDGKVKAVALTELSDKGVTLTHCAGESREEWQTALVSEIERWGKSLEARNYTAVCRPGWKRMLKDMGFRETHVVMEKSLGQE